MARSDGEGQRTSGELREPEEARGKPASRWLAAARIVSLAVVLIFIGSIVAVVVLVPGDDVNADLTMTTDIENPGLSACTQFLAIAGRIKSMSDSDRDLAWESVTTELAFARIVASNAEPAISSAIRLLYRSYEDRDYTAAGTAILMAQLACMSEGYLRYADDNAAP